MTEVFWICEAWYEFSAEIELHFRAGGGNAKDIVPSQGVWLYFGIENHREINKTIFTATRSWTVYGFVLYIQKACQMFSCDRTNRTNCKRVGGNRKKITYKLNYIYNNNIVAPLDNTWFFFFFITFCKKNPNRVAKRWSMCF